MSSESSAVILQPADPWRSMFPPSRAKWPGSLPLSFKKNKTRNLGSLLPKTTITTTNKETDLRGSVSLGDDLSLSFTCHMHFFCQRFLTSCLPKDSGRMISPSEIGREEAFWLRSSTRTERWLLSSNCPVSKQTSPVPASQKDSGQIL